MEKQELAKIAITSDSDVALVHALEKVNKDSAGGRVTKTELSSWFILKSAADLNDGAIEEIRMAHFNQVTYLENLVKTIKQSGRDSLGLDEIAKLQALMKQQNTKRKKSSQKTSSLDKGQSDLSKAT